MSESPTVDFWTAEAAFHFWSAEALTRRIMTFVEADGWSSMARCESLLLLVMEALVWKRDRFVVPLSGQSLVDHLEFDAFAALAADDHLPDGIRKRVQTRLLCLPGYAEARDTCRSEEARRGFEQVTLDQFGYFGTPLKKALSRLSEAGMAFGPADAMPKEARACTAR